MKKFLIHRWFLISLAVVLLVGMAFHSALEPLSEIRAFRNGVVATVLFLMALPLEARAVWQSLRRPLAPLLGVTVNLLLLPIFAWFVSLGLSPTWAVGLYVAAATPCTLASAAVWTRRAGGNESVAILVTIITNLSCFVVTPLWLWILTGHRLETDVLDMPTMVIQLLTLVVLPMAVAQLVRIFPPVRSWSTRNTVPIGVMAQMGILTMILLGSIHTGKQLTEATEAQLLILDLVLMIAAVLLVHVTMFYAGRWLARAAGLPPADEIAVGISGSQKTLMVGLQVAMELGVTILPMIIYHVGQLLIDTFLADRFRRQHPPADPRPPDLSDAPAGG